ncbi:MarR family winged helix-turn-helix transcriptional regulator [Dyadobacter sp. LHD-138]|uniref:MarR family winged helix-turn-helix transcriptional regulator n=1 Tax=Dyadobacter sp. LHD-138 TaxID=3071413 RepID=UPI0027DFB9B5|nr:MarR family winged helix-turn-helix transcriptional regulator [Dyadobacter sp. LHD-138]MDQ6479277.1 MarR family winged helix-turn-helix transcriptional regulator [Dyadobacter sp. LHD-138]
MDIEVKELNQANFERLSRMMLFNILNVSHLIGRNTNKELAKMGYTLQVEQIQILFFVYLREGNSPSQQEIANFSQKDKGGIQRSVQTLLRDGYVRIVSDSHDRRKNLIELTPAGKMVVTKMMESIEDIDRRMTASISQEEIDALISIVRKISNIVKE